MNEQMKCLHEWTSCMYEYYRIQSHSATHISEEAETRMSVIYRQTNWKMWRVTNQEQLLQVLLFQMFQL
jgi:hypothetical protein